MDTFEHEEWRAVEGFEGIYEISNFGRLRSLDREAHFFRYDRDCSLHIKGQFLKTHKDEDGYERINLQTDNRKSKRFGVHRLVACAFISNPENKPTVNHIDGNKQNNHVSNLEWATHQEQSDHAASTGLRTQNTYSNRKRVKEVLSMKVRCIETGAVYDSMIEAERQLGLWYGAVSESCNKGRSIHGLHFERI